MMKDPLALQLLGEFLGTFILILLGDGVVAGVTLNKSKAQNAGWVAITLGWGFAVTMGVYASSFMSPAHLNPAVSLGMAVAGKFPWAYVIPYSAAQIAGGVIGGLVVWLHYYPHWQATKDAGAILGIFATTKLLECAMTQYPRQTYRIILGFILGSVVEIFPGLPSGIEILLCAILLTAGFVIIYYLSSKEESATPSSSSQEK